MRKLGFVGLAAWCAACSYGADPDLRTDYVVVYEGQAVTLDAVGARTVARAAARVGDMKVVVAGYAEDPGAPEANQIQSRLRAQTVAEALVADGVARRRVSIEPRRALGGDPAYESRRVDIRLEPQ